jgi:hypothetical protein
MDEGLATNQLVALFDGDNQRGSYSFRPFLVRQGIRPRIPSWISPVNFAVKINPRILEEHPRCQRRSIPAEMCAAQIAQSFGEKLSTNLKNGWLSAASSRPRADWWRYARKSRYLFT